MCATSAGGTPVPPSSGVASPNASDHDAIEPSGSELADPSKTTASGALPEPGVTASCALGGDISTTVCAVAVPVCPSLSVTVRVAVYVPAVAYACAMFAGGVPDPDPSGLPSPNASAHDAI